MMGWVEQDLARYEREQARYEASLPRCANCGEPIYDEWAYEIDPGYYYCEDCAQDWLHSVRVDREGLMD